MSVRLEPGTTVYRLDEQFTVETVLDFDIFQASRDSDGKLFTLKRKDITFSPPEQMRDKIQDLSQIPKDELEKAEKRLEAITPILNSNSRRAVDQRAKEVGVSGNTLYNWIRAYESTGQLSSLVFMGIRGGKGIPRLEERQEELIKDTIKEMFSGPIYPTAQKVWEDIGLKCKNSGISIPSISTIRRRVRKYKEATFMEPKRKKNASGLIKGKYPDGLFPLHVLQIDHTEVDIILVDSTHRTELGRPWITLAIDVYSRMIAGYYISFESPGFFGVGQTIKNAVLPKDDLINKHNLQTEYPVWGIPQFVHADNAKEFRGIDIKEICREYEMSLIWRPVARPHFGGHIERMVRTLNEGIHTLKGSTQSNIFKRGDSTPQKDAVLTLEEFEEWLAIEIVEKYHNKVHKGIGMTPLEKYREGIFGGKSNSTPRGLPSMIEDVNRFSINMLPSEKRTVQRYGIQIDNVTYHSEALEGWVNAIEPNSNPPVKKKLSVRRDPWDISKIYVYDEHIEEFIEVPYANSFYPPTSLWEYNAAKRYLKKQDNRQYDEHEIFHNLERQREIIHQAEKKTKTQRKSIQREHTRKTTNRMHTKTSQKNVPKSNTFSPFELDDLEPFDVIDDAPVIKEIDFEENTYKEKHNTNSDMPF